MVERRGRDISGKWIYLCYPCAAMCSGESILQTHISGKKHKSKLSLKNVWPLSIFEEHPYVLNEKGNNKTAATEKVLQKMAEEVEIYKKNPSELDLKYDKYRNVVCHIQETLDNVKAPLLGVEYLVEHPPEQAHYEPSYICVLCIKQGYPRTIVNHLTCFWHRYNYLLRHFSKACTLLTPYRGHAKYREGVAVIMNRLATRIQDKYGRLRPINIDKEEYEKDRNQIHQWIFRGYHFCETDDCTFEEVVDADLITSLDSSSKISGRKIRDPSPPVVAAPSKPANYSARRAPAADALSDVSDEPEPRRDCRSKLESKRYEPYPEKRVKDNPFRTRFAIRNTKAKSQEKAAERSRAPNYEYKVKLAAEQRASAEELARKALAYHEKNPEKHPFYPDEWKKFWNRRYKEIQAEGKDPTKHDFKPEWIVFWTGRMKELHEEELRATVTEIYRRMRLTPPDRIDSKKPQERRKTPEHRRTPDRHRSPDRRRSPEPRHRSPLPRRRSPDPRRRSPPHRRISPETKRRTPDYRERRSPERRSPPRRRSPLRSLRTRSRSPMHKPESSRRGAPPAVRRGRSPLSRRASAPRNHSPARALLTDTVLISDEELKPDDGLSPWNSDDSLGSLPDARSPIAPSSRTGSVASRNSRRRDVYRDKGSAPQDFGSAENVVATLRLLVALEDYLGSLGPKIVDLLAEALKMEKDKANSSEELLVTERAVVLIETAKEKLKGAVQAGLVAGSAAAAVRSAVVRAAATLHEADTRMKKRKQQEASSAKSSAEAVPVAGVGAVDREQIAQQMAAALIAQGKTDVSSEELAHLVDAVVGMAEAKKREADSKRKTEARAANDKSTRAPAGSTASALQMLQSAYDDKKAEKEDLPDAMDGLSDSDLETLLKNFNELSAEEQHSLIAYLKKLEAREPQRVERLRQYVGAAATNAPINEEKSSQSVENKPINIASDDDDDYTVEDVFKSATQKVKEDQIRQEMEIVKKSLEESKAPPEVVESTATTASSNDVKKDIFSATDLLALVQASLQSTPAPTPTSAVASDVVTSNTQPRSFGDLPEPSLIEKPNPLLNPQQLFNTQTMPNQQGLLRTPNIPNYSGNQNNLIDVRTSAWEPRQTSDMTGQVNVQNENLYNLGLKQSQDSYNQGLQNSSEPNSRGSQDSYNQEAWERQGNINQGVRNPQGNFNQGPQGPCDNYNQGLRGTQENFNQGSPGSQDNYNQVSQGPQDKYNQGLRGSQENYNQGSRGASDTYNQGSRGSQETYNQVPRGPQDIYSQGSRGYQDNYNQASRGPQEIYNNQKPMGSQDNYNQGPRGPQDNYSQANHGPQDNYNQGQHVPQDNYNQGPRGLQDTYNQTQNNFNQGIRKPQDNYNQGLPSLLDNFKPGSRGQDQSYGVARGTNNSFHQGTRGNFMGNRMQDNFNNRQDGNQAQQFGGQKHGNFEKNNFRGRGRGFAKQTRGRGRGFY
ncbi:uncharacterized protein CG7065-like isoform X2 [Vanessa cardui]|nr:uncharacterized protein CG7065-like isoform X2 [Vanessa cardui]